MIYKESKLDTVNTTNTTRGFSLPMLMLRCRLHTITNTHKTYRESPESPPAQPCPWPVEIEWWFRGPRDRDLRRRCDQKHTHTQITVTPNTLSHLTLLSNSHLRPTVTLNTKTRASTL